MRENKGWKNKVWINEIDLMVGFSGILGIG